MPEISKPYRVKIRTFEGSFHDAAGNPTTSVRWATRSVALPDGPVEGRLRVSPRTSYGIGEAIGAIPQRAQATLEIDATARDLAALAAGTASDNPALEYQGDSWLNLRGKLYACYLLDDGTVEKHALTPTLTCSGSPVLTETGIVVPLASDDTAILGKPAPVARVGYLRGSEKVEDGDCFRFGTGVPASAPTWGEVQESITENLGAAIPYAYGRVALPLIETSGDECQHFAVFASRHKPKLDDVKRWIAWQGERAPGRTLWWGSDAPRLWSAKVRVTDEEEATHDLWLVLFSMPRRRRWNLADVHLLAPARNPLSAGSYVTRLVATPTNLARWIVEDLSEAATAGIHAASFDAAAKALPLPDACGGLVTGDATIGEILTHLGAPWALSWWVGMDDALHVGVPGQWSAADRAALTSPDTPRITPADFAAGYGRTGSYQETIPADAEQRGSAVRKVSIEWAEPQRKAWPADVLMRWAPGVTELPVQAGDEGRLSGAWLYPPNVADALASGMARRCFPTRRITLTMHDWIGIQERQTLALLTLPLAATGSYQERVVRLEHTADDSREYVVARFEDLGPTAAARPALFDTIANWDPGEPTGNLVITAGSDIVMMSAANPYSVGQHLHTPGASAANRRIARRIVENRGATFFRVEFAFQESETIAASPPGTAALDRAWTILDSHETYAPDGMLCAADESTGAFRSGEPGFTVSAG